MNSAGRIATGVAMAVAGLAYLALGYVAAAWEHPPLIALLVGLIPPAALALTSTLQLPDGWRALAMVAWVAVMAALLLQLDRLMAHAALFYFIQHAGAMGFLAFTFGNTLWGTHGQALCSRMAKLMLASDMDDSYIKYTWQVTAVWTFFFGVVGSLSVLLFFFGNVETWSLFANVLTPILVFSLFVGEYLVRVRVLPNRPHLSIVETIQAYQKYRRAGPTAP
jgi:uncharacterized membrane protein